MKTQSSLEFEAHLRAIEDAVTVANLDGGCDHADHVRYHAEQLRLLVVRPPQDDDDGIK